MRRNLLLLGVVILPTAGASTLITNASAPTSYSFIAAAATSEYAPQPWSALTGELILDPGTLMFFLPPQQLPAFGINPQAAFAESYLCNARNRLTPAQVQGKIVVVGIPTTTTCYLAYDVDELFASMKAMGAKGLLGVASTTFGTRSACSQRFSKWAPNVPPGRIPYFCFNDAQTFEALLSVARAAQSNLPGSALADITLGHVTLQNDPVPISFMQSSGFYVFFCLLFTCDSCVFFVSLWLAARMLRACVRTQELSLPVSLLLIILLLEGCVASSVRAVRNLQSPQNFSPRFTQLADLEWDRFCTTWPHLPSALSTLLLALDYCRIALAIPGSRLKFSVRSSYAFYVCAYSLALLLFCVGNYFILRAMTFSRRIAHEVFFVRRSIRFSDCPRRLAMAPLIASSVVLSAGGRAAHPGRLLDHVQPSSEAVHLDHQQVSSRDGIRSLCGRPFLESGSRALRLL